MWQGRARGQKKREGGKKGEVRMMRMEADLKKEQTTKVKGKKKEKKRKGKKYYAIVSAFKKKGTLEADPGP